MQKIKLVCISLLFILQSIGLSIQQVTADISPYVNKYRNIQITDYQFNKLKEFEPLIQYFCTFSYIKPRHKVSPDFIKALILAESGADPNAVSPDKAHGLGQILYSTGKQAARELASLGYNFRYVGKNKLLNLEKEDLFDPAVNILLTCYLIAKYNHKFNGKLDLVVSAWNAGENVDSLGKGEVPPYTETQDLIGKINGYYISLLKIKRFAR